MSFVDHEMKRQKSVIRDKRENREERLRNGPALSDEAATIILTDQCHKLNQSNRSKAVQTLEQTLVPTLKAKKLNNQLEYQQKLK